MVNYKSKYLEMKLKYINAKNKLTGGDLSGVEFLNFFALISHPRYPIMKTGGKEHQIVENIMGYYNPIVHSSIFYNIKKNYNFILTKLNINNFEELNYELVKKIIIELVFR